MSEPTTTAANRPSWRGLSGFRGVVLVCILAAAIRLIYALWLPNAISGWRDTQHYVSIARSIAHAGAYANDVGCYQGEPLFSDVGPTSFWLPAYPLLLAGLFAPLGESARVVFILQAVLGAATVALAYLSASDLLGKRTALWAALLLALSPFQIFYTGWISTECLAAFLLAVALYSLVRLRRLFQETGRTSRAALLALSLTVGVGVLTRSAFLAVALAVFLSLIQLRSAAERSVIAPPSTAPQGARHAFPAALVFAALVVACVFPWLIRNYFLWNRFVYSTNTGMNLYIGFNDQADGSFGTGPLRFDPAYDELQRDDQYRSLTWSWIGGHPGQTLYLALKKVLLFFNPSPGFQYGRLTWIAILWTGAFLALAFGGMLLEARSWRELGSLYLLVILFTLHHCLAFAATRFRVPLEVPLALFAAACLDRLAVRRKRPAEPRVGRSSPSRLATD